ALGESVTEGTVTRWLKAVGDQVTADEPLLEVSTDKVDTEIPAPVSGTLLSISVNEDETVDVGAELAVIGTGGSAPAAAPAAPAATTEPQSAPAAAESDYSGPAPEAEKAPEPQAAPAEKPAPTKAAPAPAAQAPAPQAPPAQAPAGGDGGGNYVTPLVRRLAADRGVDLSTVSGSGVGGRIRKQDVLAAAEQAAAPAPASAAAAKAPAARTPSPAAMPDTSVRGRTEKMSRLRAVIARRMVESLQVSAQLTTVVEADVTRIAHLRQQAKADFEAREGVRLSFLPFFAKAAVEALKAHPSVNSSIDQEAGTVTYHDTENLGIAVDTERGLLVPVIHDAGDLSLAGIARKINDLAERTRTNKITPDELGGGTFTLTNTGSRGALFDTPIINQPQVAILGTGSVVKRPVVVQDPELGEVIAVRSMVYLALTYDHRIVDGADAARFLTTVRERLEAGQFHGELGLA
ncbi:MAG: 2-oxoglutarate dehydrogenase component, partial [Blastococcus sp.]|nr:2-oxoglutarate dehydrogenase component [Blastococcus sp.]